MPSDKTNSPPPPKKRSSSGIWAGIWAGIGGLVVFAGQEVIKAYIEVNKPAFSTAVAAQESPNATTRSDSKSPTKSLDSAAKLPGLPASSVVATAGSSPTAASSPSTAVELLNWEALYVSPKQSDISPRSEADLSEVEHEQGTQKWAIANREDRLTIDVSELSNTGVGHRLWEVTGFFKRDSLVASLRGRKVGRGVLYLERNEKWDYYRGYAYLCDCQSPVADAVMVCPFVLYDPANIMQRTQARADPLVAPDQKCTPAMQPKPALPEAVAKG